MEGFKDQSSPWADEMGTFNFTPTESLNANGKDLPLVSLDNIVEVVFIILGLGSLSLITIIGNILVIVSIKVNRNLQTVNNYFLFSLACADLIIGLFSMNLYTVYIVVGYWPLGPVICDLWLALDYVMSNASVMNLLIISFDRYFCVTKPLSYPVNRTTKMAGMMIAAAWVLSFILWAPAILFWQFIVGERTVPEQECYIQFFSNAVVTFGTAIAAFYVPVITMIVLYWQISKASKSRVRRESRRVSSESQDNHQGGLTQGANQCRGKGSKGGNKADKGPPLPPLDAGTEDATTGEDQETENESTSGSVLVSSNHKEEEADAVGKTVVGQTTLSPQLKSNSNRTRANWSKLTCIWSPSLPTDTKVETFPEGSSSVSQRILKSTLRPPKRRKRGGVPSRERKVTRTIMAILVAFVVTWTPYNVMVLINTFCSTCIPASMWTFGYWLCYINSTVNPACYALCNITFKNTFKQLLLCRYKNIRSSK
ncbi:muscarinic acetylcholine receptor M2 isoform X1 [Alosa sapidissima]|uniref:muscarinic acetylcholine receptor M2 isoform X1 n=2 Tax=Alosa sapidissima TaxID=34773 RepID=UPI001C08A010|nr:muscarinic acetylcholine receptor M2 isoform X1 [Alosa sapidissima]